MERDTTAEEDTWGEYEMAKKVAGKAVAEAHQQKIKKLGEKFNIEEGQRSVFKIAKQLAKLRQDVVGVKCLKNETGFSRVLENLENNKFIFQVLEMSWKKNCL